VRIKEKNEVLTALNIALPHKTYYFQNRTAILEGSGNLVETAVDKN